MSEDQPDGPISLPLDPGRENWLRLVRDKKQRERDGPAHLRLRRDFAHRMEHGEVFICPSCELEIGPDQDGDLGHDDHDPYADSP